MAEGLFPLEVTSGVHSLTITGREAVHLEQHRGLIAYQGEEVAFRVQGGVVRVRGEGLQFKLYTASEAVLTGRVTGVIMEENGGGGA